MDLRLIWYLVQFGRSDDISYAARDKQKEPAQITIYTPGISPNIVPTYDLRSMIDLIDG